MEFVRFPSGPLALEGVFRTAPEPKGAVLLLHPHPQFGGSMDNSVVLALEEALNVSRATLRFNFRGVGESEGAYDNGRGEAEDARAALSFLESRGFPLVAVAGYSFGAWIGARVAADPRVAGLVLVSPPVSMFDFSPVREFRRPLLVVSGNRDTFVHPGKLQPWFDSLPGPKRLRTLPGDHFWTAGAPEVARTAAEWLTSVSSSAPSPSPSGES